jgi:hypothetical protein
VIIIDALGYFNIQVVLIFRLSLLGYGTVDILRHCVVHFLSQYSFSGVGWDKESAAILREFGVTNGEVFDVTKP